MQKEIKKNIIKKERKSRKIKPKQRQRKKLRK